MINEALLDLTKEPLLAYLLIFSGYASDRAQEATKKEVNSNTKRSSTKFGSVSEQSPPALILMTSEGFETLMQALGLAAWRGGGRTGDEATFTTVRDTFMRPDLLTTAKACGAADLGNVALLFYTRKDEDSGRGYEFLHRASVNT